MKNILVTGGAGFIGSNFIHHMMGYDPTIRIINLDKLTYAGCTDNLNSLLGDWLRGKVWMAKGDICNTSTVEETLNMTTCDTIVHFAAETHVDRSIHAPDIFMQTNVIGTFTLLKAAREHGIRFHHISTDEVYGSLSPSEAPWTEDSPYAPNSPYSASKAASDHLVRSYGHTYGLPYTITNCSNNYGPRQFPEKLIPLTITRALKGEAIPIYGDGKQVRDWLYVDDHCEAIRLVLEKGKLGETYNVGGGNQPTNIDIVTSICEILDELVPNNGQRSYKELIQYVEDRAGHDRRYAIDSTKIRTELGWSPKTSLQDGLMKTVKWYVERVGK